MNSQTLALRLRARRIAVLMTTALGLAFASANLQASSELLQVTIAEAFIELHTGPGRSFPIFHVVEKGQTITVHKQRTTWYKVTDNKGKTGWVSNHQFEKTLTRGGEIVELTALNMNDFSNRRWEAGLLAGSFDGANSTTLYGAYQFTENLALELSQSKILGPFSDNTLQLVSITHSAFPDWHYSPFFSLGTGTIKTKPNASIVQTQDRKDDVLRLALGMKIYLTRHFFMRAEYNEYTLLTSRDDNEERNEWRLGFSIFF